MPKNPNLAIANAFDELADYLEGLGDPASTATAIDTLRDAADEIRGSAIGETVEDGKPE